MRLTSRGVWTLGMVGMVVLCGLTSGVAWGGKGDMRPAADDETIFGGPTDDVGDEAEGGAYPRSGGRSGTPRPFWGESDPDWTPESVSASGGVGVGEGYVGAEFTLSLGYGAYTDAVLSGYYRRETFDDQESTVYGPEGGLRFKIPNPTIITPFVGAGLGNEFWSRRDAGHEFDRNRSLTAHALGGVDFRVTRGFSVSVAEKAVYYLERSASLFRDHRLSEPRFVRRLQVGFVVHF